MSTVVSTILLVMEEVWEDGDELHEATFEQRRQERERCVLEDKLRNVRCAMRNFVLV